MSAGFKVAGEVFWGTNGAVESFVEVLAELAAIRFGPEDPTTVFFREQRDAFSLGMVVYLDEWVQDPESQLRVARLLNAAASQLLSGDVLTEYGREWVRTVIRDLCTRIEGLT